jgi:hypothetical protein
MGQQQRNFTGDRLYPTHIEQVIDWFEDFSQLRMHRWRRIDAGADPRGRILHASFELSFTARVRLKPSSLLANIREGLEASGEGRGGRQKIRTIERIEYLYTVTFRFHALTSAGTRVEYETLEDVDPMFQQERDLQKHFEVISMPDGKGDIGEAFLEFADRRPSHTAI